MQAFSITAPQTVGYQTLAKPTPGPADVLLRVSYVGYCGSDLNTFRGLNPLVSYPRIPGHEVSGIIEAVGGGVPEPWRVGLPVTLSPYTSCGKCPSCRRGRFNCCQHNQTLGVQREGALTEYLVVPHQKLFTSATLSLRELAMVEPLTVGAHAVDRAAAGPADSVAVLGCGAIGLGAIAAAAFHGARVIATDIDDAKLALARQAGAAHTLNSKTVDLHTELRRLTNDDGPDVIIEAIGLPQTFRAAVDEVAFAGRVVYIGYAKAPVEYETKLIVQKELSIHGSRNATPENFRQVIAMLEAGKFPVEAAISRVCSFAEAGDGLAAWHANPPAFTKIMVKLDA